MVYEPFGYSGMLNIMGIVAQLGGFIMLLPQLAGMIEKTGKKLGDSEGEIKQGKKLVIKWGIFFVIFGTFSQLMSLVINAYWPDLFSNIH